MSIFGTSLTTGKPLDASLYKAWVEFARLMAMYLKVLPKIFEVAAKNIKTSNQKYLK